MSLMVHTYLPVMQVWRELFRLHVVRHESDGIFLFTRAHRRVELTPELTVPSADMAHRRALIHPIPSLISFSPGSSSAGVYSR